MLGLYGMYFVFCVVFLFIGVVCSGVDCWLVCVWCVCDGMESSWLLLGVFFCC